MIKVHPCCSLTASTFNSEPRLTQGLAIVHLLSVTPMGTKKKKKKKNEKACYNVRDLAIMKIWKTSNQDTKRYQRVCSELKSLILKLNSCFSNKNTSLFSSSFRR